MRIALGVLILSDLIIRATSLKAHYTNEGVLPVSLLMEFDYKPFRWSFHYLADSVLFESILFIIHGLLSILLIVGYRTKLITVLSWIFLVSLQNRNPFIQQSGDDLLRLVLFWAMFLPWGNFYSFDARKNQHPEKNYFSVATMGYLILVVSVYLFTVVYKNSPEWRTEGTAIYYALSLDQLKVGLGDWLYQYPLLMKWLTFIVFYYFELLAPLLIILPLKNKLWRAVGVISIILLHIGIVSTLYVGLFAIIGITTSIGLLPSFVIDKLEHKFSSTKHKLSDRFYHYRQNKFFNAIKSSFLVIVISFCFMMNMGNIPTFKYTLDERTTYFNDALKLEQFWGMFSPHIYKTDGWYIYRGIKSNDSIWDIYNNKAGLDFTKPKDIDKMYATDRWRKLAENFEKNTFNFMRPYYCKYLIREWNKKHPDNKIEGLNIIYLLEESLSDYKTKPIKERNICLCYENDSIR